MVHLYIESIKPNNKKSLDLLENIEQTSNSSPCKNLTICRNWAEIKNVAFCKAAKLATILPSHYELYYISTLYKSESSHEWSKLIYGFLNKDSNVVTYLKMCVPVERKKTVWIDDRCPLDDCSDFGTKEY